MDQKVESGHEPQVEGRETSSFHWQSIFYMKVLIVQVSDIHLKNGINIAPERILHIAKAVANVDVNLSAAIIALTGDVAYSGTGEEYAIAKTSVLQLKSDLEKRLRDVPVFVVGVPGNHDCNFKEEKSARPILIDSIAKEPSKAFGHDVFEQCTSVQTNFFKFLDEVQTPNRSCNVANAYYEFEIPVQDSSIFFRCYNTALCSVLHEKPGCLAVPQTLFGASESKKNHGYIISIFHHPYNWLSQYNVRTFRKHIESTSDLILTGHEHDADNYAKYTRRGESMLYLEGPAFQEHDADTYSGFNAVWVDLAIQQDKISTYSWNETLFEPMEANPKWQPFRRSRRLIAKDFQLTEEMERELEDPGAKFFHPVRQLLSLSDIFVFPDARVVVFDEKNKPLREENVESKDLLKFISNKRRLLILGKERAGKTSLAKIAYRDYYEKGFVPVLLKGEQITSLELDKFEQLVERQLVSQYQNPKLPAFNQLDRDQTVIIIDDFDHVGYPSKGRQKILANIHKRFERVLILSDVSIRLEEIADAQFAASVLSEYTQISLKDYGYFLRSKLIEKWCRLGAEYSVTEHDLECKITRYEGMIDTALQKSYLPSIPFFILIYIQSLDAAQPVSASAGSYGHLCELLISRSLATAHKAATLNTKKTYLAEMAYALFQQNAKELSDEEFQIFHQKHCAKFTLQLNREALFQELSECSILTRIDGRYSFKYPYYQHYFVALYMRDFLDDPVVKGQVESISKKLHKADNANIWLFLSHHSKNPLLVDLILAHAKSIFTETTVPKFESDISFFKKISDSIPGVVLHNKSPAELRESRRRELDAAPEDEDISDDDYEKNELVRFVAQITDALRTLDVMGQIAKNFSGSLVGPVKFQLVDECYRLGLRVAGVILGLWKDDPEKIVNEMVDMILDAFKDDAELKKITRQELTERVSGLFFFLTESMTFDMLKRISHAVGSVELVPTYREVLETSPTNAYKLVDMSVKLDALKLPTKEVVSLSKDIKENTLCSRLLRKLVVHHFYLFPTDYKTKQKICEELDIPIKELRGIDVISETQKALPASR